MCPDAVGRRNTHALLSKVHGLVEKRFRKNAIFNNLLIVIQIVDEHIKGFYALFKPFFYALPFFIWDNARNDIDGPRSVY